MTLNNQEAADRAPMRDRDPDARTDAALAARMLQDAVSHDWESLRRVVRGLHPEGEDASAGAITGAATLNAWGSAAEEGSPRWHLEHIVEVFRLHATTASGGAIVFDSATPRSAAAVGASPPPEEGSPATAMRSGLGANARTEELLVMLERDVAVFVDWLRTLSAEQWTAPFDYGRPMDLPEMIGLMTRHIVWHAAMIRARLRDER